MLYKLSVIWICTVFPFFDIFCLRLTTPVSKRLGLIDDKNSLWKIFILGFFELNFFIFLSLIF